MVLFRRRGCLRLPAVLGSASGRRGCLTASAVLGGWPLGRRAYLWFLVCLGLTVAFARVAGAQSARAPARTAALEIEAANSGRGGPLCMVHYGAPLPPDARIWLVQPDTPQSVATAVPGSGRCGAWADLTEKALVPLRVVGGTLDSMRLSIAIVGARTAPVLRDGVARADLAGDGVPERFRACTSSEGVHLTIWSGERLRWHRYFYLGYDVEPSCTGADNRDPAPGAALGRPASPTGS